MKSWAEAAVLIVLILSIFVGLVLESDGCADARAFIQEMKRK